MCVVGSYVSVCARINICNNLACMLFTSILIFIRLVCICRKTGTNLTENKNAESVTEKQSFFSVR